MSYFQQYWPVQNLSAVCAEQNIAGNSNAVLNGTFADSNVPSLISFRTRGFSRVVSITSTNNLSADTFTITGLQNGAPVVDVITGPNNTTVYGILAFDIITSVHVDNACNGVSIGTGDAGYLSLIKLNSTRKESGSLTVSATVPLIPAPGIHFSGYLSLDQIANNGISFDAMGPNGTGILHHLMFGPAATASTIVSYITPFAQYALIHVETTTNPTTDTLLVSVLES